MFNIFMVHITNINIEEISLRINNNKDLYVQRKMALSHLSLIYI
jgi:hypothetical protein